MFLKILLTKENWRWYYSPRHGICHILTDPWGGEVLQAYIGLKKSLFRNKNSSIQLDRWNKHSSSGSFLGHDNLQSFLWIPAGLLGGSSLVQRPTPGGSLSQMSKLNYHGTLFDAEKQGLQFKPFPDSWPSHPLTMDVPDLISVWRSNYFWPSLASKSKTLLFAWWPVEGTRRMGGAPLVQFGDSNTKEESEILCTTGSMGKLPVVRTFVLLPHTHLSGT